jgi:23S rRNA pseudouridine1911/1915/1917 synthase
MKMDFSVAPNPAVPYRLAYADDHVLVVDKPAGVVTEPGKKHAHDSLLNGLFTVYGRFLQNLGEQRDWGLLHRLDKDTSGLVIVALRNRAYDALRAQFEDRRIQKVYWALVAGQPRPAQGVSQKPIAELLGTRKRAVIRRDGQPAITAYRTLASSGGVSLVEARPKTGRLHQIRVHFAELGCPVLGETIYGERSSLPRVPRLCLHAAQLSFVHPEANRRLMVRSQWPQDLATTLRRFGLPSPSFAKD